MEVGKLEVGWIVLMQDREDLPALVGDSNMVLAGVEIVDPELW